MWSCVHNKDIINIILMSLVHSDLYGWPIVNSEREYIWIWLDLTFLFSNLLRDKFHTVVLTENYCEPYPHVLGECGVINDSKVFHVNIFRQAKLTKYRYFELPKYHQTFKVSKVFFSRLAIRARIEVGLHVLLTNWLSIVSLQNDYMFDGLQ